MQTPQPGQLRAGAHSDYGSLTLLMQGEGASGLEILNRQQEWVPVTPCKPQVVVNLGDLMERWTNGKWVSSLHRVVPPEFEKTPQRADVLGIFSAAGLGCLHRRPTHLP